METNKSIIKNLKLKNKKTENSQCLRWYEDTLSCYNRHFDCLGCELLKLTSGKCRLKNVVQGLLLKGIYPPKKEEGCFPGMTSGEILVTEAIYEGHVTREQISNYTGLSEPSVQSILSPLYSLAEINGLNFKEGKMLPQLVKFLLKRKDESMAKHEIYYDSDLDLNYSEAYKPLISAIKSGYTTYSDLEDKTDIKRGTLSFQFSYFADFLITGGFISNTTGKSKRELVIDFIQSRLIKIHSAESDSIGNELSGKENPGCYIEKLTKTEEKVKNLLMDGLNYKQIAQKLFLSITTVKSHVNNIFSKRNYHSLQELLCSEFKGDADKPAEVTPSSKTKNIEEWSF